MRPLMLLACVLAGCEEGATAQPGGAPAGDAAPADAAPLVTPTVRILSGPPTPSGAEAVFTFEASPAEAELECALDEAVPAPCTSPLSLQVEEGSHRLHVRALLLGRTSAVVEHAWLSDQSAPDLLIRARPEPRTREDHAEVRFESSEAGSRFFCTWQGAEAECASPWSASGLGEGEHRLGLRVEDPLGNARGESLSWIVDRSPPETRLGAAPDAQIAATEARFEFDSPDEDAVGFECSLDAGPFVECSAPHQVEVAGGEHSFAVRALDGVGLVDPTPASHRWRVFTSGPGAFIASGPPALTRAEEARFDFGPAGLAFECALDGGDFEGCETPLQLVALAEGEHRLQLVGVDALGNRDLAPAEHRWRIDRRPPALELIGAPPPRSTSARAELRFEVEPGARVLCNLDDAGWAECASPHVLVALVEGAHRLELRAVDAAGNQSSTLRAEWSVDTRPPRTRITARPPEAVAAQASVEVAFASEAGARFECRLDGHAWLPCASPFVSPALPEGAHQLQVRAIDEAGNTEPEPAVVTWLVDGEAPQTQLIEAPPPLVARPAARFVFGPEDATFSCQLDGAEAQACARVFALEGLADGPHQLHVRATDAVGNTDASPAEHRWTVDTRPPTLRITQAPAPAEDEDHVAIGFEADEPSSFECGLDQAPLADCRSPLELLDLAEGPHAVTLQARDTAGNLGAPVQLRFEVDLTAPRTVVVSGPPRATAEAHAAFVFGPAGLRFSCSLDQGPWFDCEEEHVLFEVAEGFHDLWVIATDAAGNADATPASYDWTVDRTAPLTELLAGPPPRTQEAGADFAFAGEPGARIECALDGAAWALCASPMRLDGLEEGEHWLLIRSVDASGNLEVEPVEVRWTVDWTPPEAPLLRGWPGDRTALLRWDPPAVDVVGYRVSRGAAEEGPFEPLHEGWLEPNGDPTWYLDEARPNELAAWYRVEAIDGVELSSGPSAAVEVLPTVRGQWVQIPDVPVRAWHGAVLPTGRVVMWQSGESMRVFDPVTETWGEAIQSPSNKFCSGMTMLADGRLLAVGGHENPIEQDGHRDWLGLDTAEIFDPFTETWTAIDPMPGGPRWYPSVRLMADGKVVVLAGIDARFAHPHRNPNIDVYDPIANSWETVAPLEVGLARTFPRSFLLPDGRLLFPGGQADTWVMETETWTFERVGRSAVGRGGGGFATRLGSGEILYVGGPGVTAELYDPEAQRWSQAAPVGVQRIYPNTAYFPDGRVLLTGGRTAQENVLRTQLYDRVTDSWAELGDHHYTHEYHSVLLPLTDGRFFAAGDQAQAEFFYPWYLTAGPRPEWIEAPEVVRYGEAFTVRVSHPLPPGPFTFVRTGGNTHAVNHDQHHFTLDATPNEDGTWTLAAPTQATVAPPGYYMLWAQDLRGVPSEARFVRLSLD